MENMKKEQGQKSADTAGLEKELDQLKISYASLEAEFQQKSVKIEQELNISLNAKAEIEKEYTLKF